MNNNTRKYFERTNLPTNVKNNFHNYVTNSHINYCNGSAVPWTIQHVDEIEETYGHLENWKKDFYIELYGEKRGKQMMIVDDYLIEQGCSPSEEVLILYSW